jgi:hypothetical protein
MIKYHWSVLEAKLYLGNGLVCSLAMETIENIGEYNDKISLFVVIRLGRFFIFFSGGKNRRLYRRALTLLGL